MAEFILEDHRRATFEPDERAIENARSLEHVRRVLAEKQAERKAEMAAASSDFVECVRWVRFKPVFNQRGDLTGVDVEPLLKSAPKDMAGPTVKVTFKVPKRVFGPVADVLVDLDGAQFDGTPEVLAQDLQKLRDSLK